MKRTKIILQIVLALLLAVATVAFVLDKSAETASEEGFNNNIRIEKPLNTNKPNWKHPLGDVYILPAQFEQFLFHSQMKFKLSNVTTALKKNSLHNANTHS